MNKETNIPFFYDNEISTTEIYTLNHEEAKHAIRSLRLKKGDIIVITNGKGQIYKGKLINDHYQHAEVVIVSVENMPKKNYYVHVALSITQQAERFEWFVEKATELGIDEITPIICQRTEKKNLKTERLQKIAIASIKQSRQAYLPKINEAIPFEQLITKNLRVNKGIAACHGTRQKIQEWIKTSESSNFLLAIGPEGDFTPIELTAAKNVGYTILDLGPNTLRSETAALILPAYLRFVFF